jgi:hypothetical protein
MLGRALGELVRATRARFLLGSVELEVEIAMKAVNGGRVVFHGAELEDMFRAATAKAATKVIGKVAFGSTRRR